MKTLWPRKWKIDKGIEKEKRERERDGFCNKVEISIRPSITLG